jgi:hypothetical protein
MKQTIYAALILSLIVATSCFEENSNHTTTATKSRPRLTVVVSDLSGSTKDTRQMTEQDWQQLVDAQSSAGCCNNVLSWLPMGNFVKQVRTSQRCDFGCYEQQLADANMEERLEVQNKNLATTAKDKQKSQAFLKNIRTIQNGYKPKAGADLTLTSDALDRLKLLLNEAQFKDYEKVVVIISDGLEQTDSQKMAKCFEKAIFSQADATFYLVRWHCPTTAFGNGKILKFESPDGIFNVIKN